MDGEIGVFTPEQAAALWRDLQSRQKEIARPTPAMPMQRRETNEPSPHRFFVKNTEAEVIPPYACMRITGTSTVAGRLVLDVEKPTATTGEFIFNSPYEIPATVDDVTGVGWAYRHGVVVMLGPGGSVTPGDEYTPVIGSWVIAEGDGPFVAYGKHESAATSIIGRIQGVGDAGSSSGGSGSSTNNCECSNFLRGTPIDGTLCCRSHEAWGVTLNEIAYTLYYQSGDTWSTYNADGGLDNPYEVTCGAGTDEYDIVMVASSTLSTLSLVARTTLNCPEVTLEYEREGKFRCQGSNHFKAVDWCNVRPPACLCVSPDVASVGINDVSGTCVDTFFDASALDYETDSGLFNAGTDTQVYVPKQIADTYELSGLTISKTSPTASEAAAVAAANAILSAGLVMTYTSGTQSIFGSETISVTVSSVLAELVLTISFDPCDEGAVGEINRGRFALSAALNDDVSGVISGSSASVRYSAHRPGDASISLIGELTLSNLEASTTFAGLSISGSPTLTASSLFGDTSSPVSQPLTPGYCDDCTPEAPEAPDPGDNCTGETEYQCVELSWTEISQSCDGGETCDEFEVCGVQPSRVASLTATDPCTEENDGAIAVFGCNCEIDES